MIAASTLKALRLLRSTASRRRHRLRRVRLDSRRASRPADAHAARACTSRTRCRGWRTRVLSRWADAVGRDLRRVGRHSLRHPERAEVTGNPVRPAVLASDPRGGARARSGLPEDALVLLVFGGSRGARHLNSALVGAARPAHGASPTLHVVHVAGRAEYDIGAPRRCERRAETRRAVARARLHRRHGLRARGGGPRRRPRGRDVDRRDHGPRAAGACWCRTRTRPTTTRRRTRARASRTALPCSSPTPSWTTNASVTTLVALLGDPERRATMAAASRTLGRPDAAERVVALARTAALRGADTD